MKDCTSRCSSSVESSTVMDIGTVCTSSTRRSAVTVISCRASWASAGLGMSAAKATGSKTAAAVHQRIRVFRRGSRRLRKAAVTPKAMLFGDVIDVPQWRLQIARHSGLTDGAERFQHGFELGTRVRYANKLCGPARDALKGSRRAPPAEISIWRSSNIVPGESCGECRGDGIQ